MQSRHRTSAAEIKHQEGPIDASNVMYYDSKAKAPTKDRIQDGKTAKKLEFPRKTGHGN